MLFPTEAENSSPVLEDLELADPCGNIAKNSTEIYAVPYQVPQSQHDKIAKAGRELQSPGQYEGPNNSIYEYPEGRDSRYYNYPPAEKSGKLKIPEEKRNGEKSHDVAVDGNYTPLIRSQGDKDDNEAPGYQPLMHGERTEGTNNTEVKDKPDELIYITMVDSDHSHGCENNGCAATGNVEEGELGIKI